jgi:hypothetical protein
MRGFQQVVLALLHAPRIVLNRLGKALDRISEPYREQYPDGGYCWQCGDAVPPEETQCRDCHWSTL